MIIMILGIIRNILGRCPACGGRLYYVDHCDLHYDAYCCSRCGKIWYDNFGN